MLCQDRLGTRATETEAGAFHHTRTCVALTLAGKLTRRFSHGIEVAVRTLGERGASPEQEMELVMPTHLEMKLAVPAVRHQPCIKRLVFSTFPMFVPSLSW